MQIKKHQLESDTEQWTVSIEKGVRQGCILSPCLFNFYAEYIMQNAKVGSQDTPGVTGKFSLGEQNEAGK